MKEMPARPFLDHLISQCRDVPILKMAVVCPHRAVAMGGAIAAQQENLIVPIFVGQQEEIAQTAKEAGFDIDDIEIVAANSDEEAAHLAVELVHQGRAQSLMKGHIHSDTLLAAVVSKEDGLRTERWLSHCFLMDIPGWKKPVLITDAALNIEPSIKRKISIARNAIDLMQTLGVEHPKLALLSSVESSNPAIQSSIDAAEIVQNIKDSRIEDGTIDGPFALDIAVSIDAAKIKGIVSPVAGDADILLVPNLDAGNILFKALTFLAGSEAAGLVVGASVPIVLTSRANSEKARVASCAMALLFNENDLKK